MKKLLLLLVLSFSLSASAAPLSVSKINQLIKEAKANWIAKENSISRLSSFERKRLLGSTDLPLGHGLFENRNLRGDAIDWRNIDGVNWLGPVMNQGNCGSCVAFASVASLEGRYRISSGLSWLMPTFSPQQLFACGGYGCDYGWQGAGAANFLKRKGVVDNACSPYESGSTGEDVQCKENFCQNQAERTYKIFDYTRPSSSGGSAEKVKAALKQGPLLTTMTVYSDFMNYAGGIYKSVSNTKEGGHAISLVGFNDQERYWIIRNSWGPDWGEGGFARVSYDDKSGIADNTWAFDVKKEEQYISISHPVDQEYVSGMKTIEIKSLKEVTAEIFIQGENDSLKKNVCEENPSTVCQFVLDSTTLKDGRYEIVAASNGRKSQVREFFVLNHTPNTSLSFKGSTGVDLSKPVKGRIEFDVDVQFSPVPPQKVIFIVENEAGEKVYRRDTDLVVQQMKLGFRTTVLPNGKYTLYYKSLTPVGGSLFENVSNKEVITIQN